MSDVLDKLNAINASAVTPPEKADKKLDLIIFKLVDMESHEGRICGLEDSVKIVKSNIGLLKWVTGCIGAAFTAWCSWRLNK